MAYYPYQHYTQQYTPMTGQNTNSGLNWVQGVEAAKSYMVAPNNTVLLLDSEQQRFYIKSSDASGMPLPLRIFEYAEITQNPANKPGDTDSTGKLSSYVTKAELAAFRAEIEGVLKNIAKTEDKNNAEPAV